MAKDMVRMTRYKYLLFSYWWNRCIGNVFELEQSRLNKIWSLRQ